jgi:hypothetical protein
MAASKTKIKTNSKKKRKFTVRLMCARTMCISKKKKKKKKKYRKKEGKNAFKKFFMF